MARKPAGQGGGASWTAHEGGGAWVGGPGGSTGRSWCSTPAAPHTPPAYSPPRQPLGAVAGAAEARARGRESERGYPARLQARRAASSGRGATRHNQAAAAGAPARDRAAPLAPSRRPLPSTRRPRAKAPRQQPSHSPRGMRFHPRRGKFARCCWACRDTPEAK